METSAGPIQIDAFLADSVVVADGKLYAQGAGWNLLHVGRLPVRHPRTGLGLLVNVPYTETEVDHELRLTLEDSEGRHLRLGDEGDSISAALRVGRPGSIHPGDDQIVPMALNLDGLVFERAERHVFVIAVDGHITKRLAFRVLVSS